MEYICESAFCKNERRSTLKFRPCIDIHNGKVKQVVGSTIVDEGDKAKENFVSEKGAAYYADMYKNDGLTGGHIILLNHKDSEYFEATKTQALEALEAFQGGMQIGGGINVDNAEYYLKRGASHVIVLITACLYEFLEVRHDAVIASPAICVDPEAVIDFFAPIQ